MFSEPSCQNRTHLQFSNHLKIRQLLSLPIIIACRVNASECCKGILCIRIPLTGPKIKNALKLICVDV